MLAARTPPDILWMGDGQVDTYVKIGYLENLSPLFRQAGVTLDVLPITGELASVDGGLYFMPYDWGTWALYYHRTLFDEAGIAYPNHDWTWTDYTKAAQRLTRVDGDRPVQFGSKSMQIGWWGSWVQLVWQAGAELTDPAMQVALPDINAVTAAFQFARDLTWVAQATPRSGFDISGAAVANGKLAMDWDLPGKFHLIRKTLEPHQWGIAPFPKGDGSKGRHAAQTYTVGFAIPKDAKNKQAAVRFMAYIHRAESQKRLTAEANLLAPSRSVLTNWLLQPSTRREMRMPDSLVELFNTVDQYSHPLPDLRRFEDFMGAVQPHFNGVMANQLNPRQAAEMAKQQATSTLR